MNRGLEKLSDKTILSEMKNANGDYEKYFNVIYERHKDGLYLSSLLILENRDDAEGNVQETFEKLHKSFRDFNPEYAFTTWIYRISRNNAMDKLKEKNNVCFFKKDCFTAHAGRMNLNSEDITIEEYFSMIDRVEESPEELLLRNEGHEKVRSYLSNMKYLSKRKNGVNYQSLLDLFYFQEKFHEEMSEKLGIRIGSVKKGLNKAREILGKELSRDVYFS